MSSSETEIQNRSVEELLAMSDDLADRFATSQEESETQRQKLRTLIDQSDALIDIAEKAIVESKRDRAN